MASQCIVINEIMVNGPGSNDGQNSPNTEEWIELYNTCSSPVDIGCYVLTDGDYGITIPSGTLLQPGDYYTIGSINAGFPVDLDLANCGCAGGNNVGVLTNGNEQMLLFDAAYNLTDGLIWGGGQMPVNFYQVAYTGCTGHNYSLNTTVDLENLPSGGEQGCVLHRACDGSMDWLEDCSGGTPGASNGGTPNYEVVLPTSPLCVGDCFEWQINDPTGILSIEWNMEGALNTASTDVSPIACYDQPGNYSIEVQINSTCGTQDISLPAAIQIEELAVTITASSAQSPCPGESVIISTSIIGDCIWYFNNEPLQSLNTNSIEATETGEYEAELTLGACSALSNTLNITYIPAPEVGISVSPTGILCPGTAALITADTDGSNHQWYHNNLWFGTGNTIEVFEGGDYYYTCEFGSCDYSSATLSIVYEAPIAPVLTATATTPCPDDIVNLTLTPSSNSIDWLRDAVVFQSTTSSNININQSGIYSAQIETINGCIYTSNELQIEYIQLIAPVVVLSSGSDLLCPGSSAGLTASGAFDSFLWYNASTALTIGTNYTATTTGDYSVVGTWEGCSISSNSINIVVLNAPTLDLAPSGEIVSCTQPYVLNLVNDLTLSWTWNNLNFTPNNTNTLDFAGDYTIIATSEEGCESQVYAFSLTFIEAQPILISSSNATPCDGSAVELSATGPYQQWQWTNGGTTTTTLVTTSGIYSVTGASSNGCEYQANIEIEFLPLPVLEVTPVVASDCVYGAVLQAQSNGDIEWQNSIHQTIGTGETLLVDPEANTIFHVISSINSCTTESWVTVTVDCETLFIPNAFTPNGDGTNDVFEVVIDNWSAYHLQIFDRWGSIVFESTDPSEVWTGGVSTHYVPDGIYHYRLTLLTEAGEPIGRDIDHYGHITITR